ncbi:MAG: MBL fold metallo-hydrolase [Gemmatimonadota bacterium]
MPHPFDRPAGTAALLMLVVVLATLPASLRAQDFADVEIRTTQITPSIFMLQGSGGNIAVSTGDDGTLIVDDQYAPLADRIVAAIAEVTDDPVDFVINSHWHFDHSDGNESFGAMGALIVAQENSRTRMLSDQYVAAFDRLQEAYSDEGLPRITFGRSMNFHYNGDTIEILHFGPAHTDGDAIIHFRDSNVIHTGDVFVRYGLPFIDEPNGGDVNGMIRTCKEVLARIDVDTRIIPGHGQPATREDLAEYVAMLETARDSIQALVDRGLSLDEIQAEDPTDVLGVGGNAEVFVAAVYNSLVP